MIHRPNLKGVRIGQTTNPNSKEFHRLTRRTICLLLYETDNEQDADEVETFLNKRYFHHRKSVNRVIDPLTIGSEKKNHYVYLALSKQWKMRRIFGLFS